MCGNTFVKNSEKWRTKRKRQAMAKSYSVNTLTQTGKIYDHVLCALGRKEQFVLSFFCTVHTEYSKGLRVSESPSRVS